MKSLALLYFSPILLLSLAESCCEQPSNGLKNKWMHPLMRKRAVEMAQKRMLSILGLDNFPKPGRHVIPHDYMVEVYRNLSSGNYRRGSYSDELPTAVVGIVDRGQFIVMLRFFVSVSYCLYLFCISDELVSRFLSLYNQAPCVPYLDILKLLDIFIFVFFFQNNRTTPSRVQVNKCFILTRVMCPLHI